MSYLIFLVGDILLWGLLDRIFPTNPGLLTVWPPNPPAPPRGFALTGKLELESPLILIPGPSDFRLFLFRSSWIPFRRGFDWAGNDWRICWFLSNFDSLISDVPLRRSIKATSSWWGPHRCNTVRGVSAGYNIVLRKILWLGFPRRVLKLCMETLTMNLPVKAFQYLYTVQPMYIVLFFQ